MRNENIAYRSMATTDRASWVDFLRRKGYPLIIKGNDGYEAMLCGIQNLMDGDYEAIYRYDNGECCHDLDEINQYFEVIER